MNEEEQLKDSVIKQREWYDGLDDELKRDCQIKRSVESGEMHNWFVCMRVFDMSSAELSTRYKEIRSDPEHLSVVTATNKLIRNLKSASHSLYRMVIERKLQEGQEVSKLQLSSVGLS